jgi:hypothetical protein
MQEPWRTDPGGVLWAQVNGFKLVVQPPAADGSVRFMVMRCRSGTGGPMQPVASGHEDNVRAAMASAERFARRLA